MTAIVFSSFHELIQSRGVTIHTVVTATSKLSLVGLSACRKSVVASLSECIINIAHDDVRTQRDQIPFFDDQ